MTPEERAELVCERYTPIYTYWGDLPSLVAQAIKEAIAEEREACAQVAEGHNNGANVGLVEDDGSGHCCGVDETCGQHVAAAIRSRVTP